MLLSMLKVQKPFIKKNFLIIFFSSCSLEFAPILIELLPRFFKFGFDEKRTVLEGSQLSDPKMRTSELQTCEPARCDSVS